MYHLNQLELEDELMLAAFRRGHGPLRKVRQVVVGRHETLITCSACGVNGSACANPPANGIDIAGELVALDCPNPKELK